MRLDHNKLNLQAIGGMAQGCISLNRHLAKMRASMELSHEHVGDDAPAGAHVAELERLIDKLFNCANQLSAPESATAEPLPLPAKSPEKPETLC